ncbi:ADP-ribosylglycohydrolase family protein [Halomonas sp. Bachu 37]|uniref:ADP-ribosylglycohydrolase family protein n=1 Tax=Halomonas kashgarensis TaxID=3084920 RepID=UPI0032169534
MTDVLLEIPAFHCGRYRPWVRGHATTARLWWVTRVAPVGLFGWYFRQSQASEDVFRLGAELGALTHGHPTGQLTAGVFAVLVLSMTDEASLAEALVVPKACLRQEPHHEETLRAILQAEALANTGTPHAEAIAGNLLAVWLGEHSIPAKWMKPLELRDVIAEMAEDLLTFPAWDIDDAVSNEAEYELIWRKYPGFDLQQAPELMIGFRSD